MKNIVNEAEKKLDVKGIPPVLISFLFILKETLHSQIHIRAARCQTESKPNFAYLAIV